MALKILVLKYYIMQKHIIRNYLHKMFQARKTKALHLNLAIAHTL